MVNLQDPQTLRELTELAEKVAVGTCRDYPGVNPEDIRQSLLLFIFENAGSLKMKVDGGNPRTILNKVARMLANKERTEQLQASVQYHYRPSDVRQMLETYLGSGDSTKTFVPDDARSEAGNDNVEIASDLAAAIKRLEPNQREVIIDRYVNGNVPINSSYRRKLLDKTIMYLATVMNTNRGRISEGAVGQRKVVSNARASALIHQEW